MHDPNARDPIIPAHTHLELPDVIAALGEVSFQPLHLAGQVTALGFRRFDLLLPVLQNICLQAVSLVVFCAGLKGRQGKAGADRCVEELAWHRSLKQTVFRVDAGEQHVAGSG